MTNQTVDATIEPVQDPSKRYRCRHIFIDGHRCGSPSLRGEHLCYYHHITLGFAEEKRLRREWTEFELPPLEDRSSVLAAVTEVLQRIACDKLPAKQAGLLLYGLQIASNNLPEPDEAKAKSDNQPPVEQVMINPRYGDLAPVAEMPEDATSIQIAEVPNPVPASEGQNSISTSEDSNTVQTSDQPGVPHPALEDVGEAPPTSQPAAPEPTILPNLNASSTTTFTSHHSERSEEPPHSARSATSRSGKPLNPKPEINISNPAPSGPTWYPNSCHANEKRTPRPPHSAHRHQATQRSRPRRRHAVDGLQLA